MISLAVCVSTILKESNSTECYTEIWVVLKVNLAEIMGHVEVHMQLTYIQTIEDVKRTAGEKIAT